MGGPHATLRPEEAAAHCDHLVVGEAEETWPQFLDEFHRGCARPRYLSIRAPSLAGLPIPRRDLIRRRPFTKGAVFATRGCPYRCSYCNLKQIYHSGFRTRPVPEVVADIQSMANRYFVFWDDNFFGDVDYALRLLTALKGRRKRWAAQVSIDRCADKRLLRLARESGCVYLFIGLLETLTVSLALVVKLKPIDWAEAWFALLANNKLKIPRKRRNFPGQSLNFNDPVVYYAANQQIQQFVKKTTPHQAVAITVSHRSG